jgi:hypothetical protein
MEPYKFDNKWIEVPHKTLVPSQCLFVLAVTPYKALAFLNYPYLQEYHLIVFIKINVISNTYISLLHSLLLISVSAKLIWFETYQHIIQNIAFVQLHASLKNIY